MIGESQLQTFGGKVIGEENGGVEEVGCVGFTLISAGFGANEKDRV